jgi:tetratricopeptide (TPR) repeat protein
MALVLGCCPQPGLSRTRVVIIGVRDYTGNALTKPVAFAENDARNFGVFTIQRALDPAPVLLTLPRVQYQLNGMTVQSKVASLPAVENELTALFAQAEPQNTIYIFISSRGIARPSLDGYIGTADMVSEKPESGGLPLRFVRQLIQGSNVGRVIIFADVSRKPPDVLANNINRRVAQLGEIPKVAGVLATQPGELSEEKANPQPGQGYFGYYLLNSGPAGLMGVSAVYSVLRRGLDLDPATKGKQKPAEIGGPAKTAPLWRAAFTPSFEEWRPSQPKPPVLLTSMAWFAGLLALQTPYLVARLASVRAELERPEPVANPQALAASVEDLRTQIADDEWQPLQSLAIEKLAGDGQRAVDRYGMQNLLPDDPLRVKPEEFKKAAEEFSAALQLVPLPATSSSQRNYAAFREELTVRKLLCEGLSGPAVVIGPLNQAKGLSAIIPEVHNAIGIYYLESIKDYDQAIREFTEAKKASPGWIYPRHNLALALIEKGDYAAAEREYREAIATQSQQPYVYYNLGLLLHRMNRRSAAKDAYQKAWSVYQDIISELRTRAADWQDRLRDEALVARQRIDVYDTNRAEVLNAWGILLASGRDAKGAREKYHEALAINGDLCAARDNWAQLEQSAALGRDRNAVSTDALDLLDQNLARSACAGFHPSLLQRARLRLKKRDLVGARADFARVHDLVPSNTEALTGMAAVDSVKPAFESAIQLLNQALAIQTGSGGAYPAVYVQLAEVQRQAGDPAACRDSYRKAITAASATIYDVSTRELRKRSAKCGQVTP